MARKSDPLPPVFCKFVGEDKLYTPEEFVPVYKAYIEKRKAMMEGGTSLAQTNLCANPQAHQTA